MTINPVASNVAASQGATQPHTNVNVQQQAAKTKLPEGSRAEEATEPPGKEPPEGSAAEKATESQAVAAREGSNVKSGNQVNLMA